MDLRSFTPAELSARAVAAGEAAYRGEQLFRWLHGRGVEGLEGMSNVPQALREALQSEAPLTPLVTEVLQEARDGTRKFRFRTHDGRAIESVLIPDDKEERDKLTLCVSS